MDVYLLMQSRYLVQMWHIMFWLILPLFLFFTITNSKPNIIKYNSMFSIFYIVTGCVCGLLWPFLLLRPRDERNSNALVYVISYIVGKIYGIKWILRNREILSEERGAVIVSNHQMSLDILGLFTIWDDVGRLVVIAKKQLSYLFPFGPAAYLAGTVFIDRNNPQSAYELLNKTSDVMVRKKTKIWFFPEGTRNKDYTRLLPFKKGAFKIAVAAQVPIIPVVFSPYYFINAQKYIFSKGHIIIQPLEAIPTVGLTMDDVPDLIARVHDSMTATYKKLSEEVLSDLPENYPYTNIG